MSKQIENVNDDVDSENENKLEEYIMNLVENSVYYLLLTIKT